MKIIDLLDDRSILLDGRVADKKAALDQMVELMDASGKLRDKETYRQVCKRTGRKHWYW